MDVGFLSVIAIFAVVFVLLAFVVVYASRVKKVGPNEVLVVSGFNHKLIVGQDEAGKPVIAQRGYRIITGGRAFIWPILERVDYLSLELMTIEVAVKDVYTLEGVPVMVDGVAQVKIGSDEVFIATAAERFLSKSQDEIEHVAHETLAGHLRAILGTLTVEEIYKEREKFGGQVQDVSTSDLSNMGLQIDSFVIKDVQDEEGYLEALGRKRIAEVKRDATIGEAEAERDSVKASAKARQEGEEARFQAETKIAEAEKIYAVQKASYDAEVNRQKAEAELAYTLQQNITNQQVKAESVQIEVVEKQKQIEVQEQEVLRRERELDATVRKPAEAQRYEIETLANAKKFQTLTEAEGQAEATRSIGQGEADANKARGLAQANVIQEQGLAEAEAMLKKAGAWQEYNEAAIIQQLIDHLPEVAEAISAPLAKTDKITIVSTGGDGGGAGASKIAQDTANIITQIPAMVQGLTGVDLIEAIKRLPAMKGNGLDDATVEESFEQSDAASDETILHDD
ncbi:MAG: SPFH domain-containing protein [Anaerolineae bacterium]|nr:SPFH domain-containing protein [Anaerolineae bacterium]